MRGRKCTVLAATILGLLMILTTFAPLSVAQAGDTHLIMKGDKGPRASAVTWEFSTGEYPGLWSGLIANNGFRTLTIEVSDNTTGMPYEVFSTRIRFAEFNAYPTGTVATSEVLLEPNRIYEISAIPNGPKGSSAIVTDQFDPVIPPIASFTGFMNWQTLSVDASGSSDSDGTIVSYEWEWGDGTTGTGMTAMHTYYQYGIFVVVLTVTDNDGLTDSESMSVKTEPPIVISFTVNVDDLTVYVDASGISDPDGAIVSYEWNWGDGQTGSGVIATHTYSTEGTYVITLTMTYDDGSTSSISKSVTVSEAKTITYTISNMFEHYLKPRDYSKLGRWGSEMGVNSWFDLRQPNYGEWIVRNTYPFVMGYNPYSTQTTSDISVGNVLTTWYRMYIDGKDLPNAATGASKDPILVPMPDANAGMTGGWVNISWYSTYMMTQELLDLRSNGIHYGNFYYGVPTRVTPNPLMDDGYWHELQGNVSFTRDACKKFLALTATGDLEDEFNANKIMIEGYWFDDWMVEGSGKYDIYTAYDYPDDIRYLGLIVDPVKANTDPNTLHLRLYSLSWGNEVLLMRYLEAAGLLPGWQPFPDDFYLNATIGPVDADFSIRAVMGYHMMAWADLGDTSKAAWSLEAVHIDWCGNTYTHSSYQSPFNAYDPDVTDAKRMSWAPGTMHFGEKVSYWISPMEMDLQTGETLIVKLRTYGKIVGYTPYKAVSDTLNSAKLAEWNANSYLGDATIGAGWPNDLSSYYDAGTKTLTLTGPMDFPRLPNSDYPSLLETGSPTIIIDVV